MHPRRFGYARGSTMTIVPFLRDSVFGPQDTQAISAALDDVWKILNLAEEARSEKELLAKKIIAFAHHCPRDRMLREIISGRGEIRLVGSWRSQHRPGQRW